MNTKMLKLIIEEFEDKYGVSHKDYEIRVILAFYLENIESINKKYEDIHGEMPNNYGEIKAFIS